MACKLAIYPEVIAHIEFFIRRHTRLLLLLRWTRVRIAIFRSIGDTVEGSLCCFYYPPAVHAHRQGDYWYSKPQATR
jgi:hypothetical protein